MNASIERLIIYRTSTCTYTYTYSNGTTFPSWLSNISEVIILNANNNNLRATYTYRGRVMHV